jgi:MacB-like periplasmic core domain
MNLKSLAIVFYGFLALSTAACREHTYELWNEEDQAPWLSNVLAAEVTLPATGTETAKKLSQLLGRAAAMPGVEKAALVNVLPGAVELSHQVQIQREGFPSHLRPAGSYLAVSPGYFETMGLRLLRGRYFSESDHASGPLVAIVNESYARFIQYPGDKDKIHEDLLGKRVKIGWHSGPWLTIVGIVQDGPRARNVAEMYVPYLQHTMFAPSEWPRPAGVPSWYLLVRTGQGEEMAAPLQKNLGMEFRPMRERLEAYRKAHEH